MKQEGISFHHLGLTSGILFAGLHLFWLIFAAIAPKSLQGLLDWLFQIHTLAPIYEVTTAHFLPGLFLVLVTFAVGYGLGALFALIWNFTQNFTRDS